MKTSFTSTPEHDLSEIAAFFGWGWHKQAAWFTSEKTLAKVEEEILNKIKKEFKNNYTLWNN